MHGRTRRQIRSGDNVFVLVTFLLAIGLLMRKLDRRISTYAYTSFRTQHVTVGNRAALKDMTVLMIVSAHIFSYHKKP